MSLDPHAFNIRRERLSSGAELAFVHEGVGGYPLLLVHGWPESKRIWWRNVDRLAGAGFEVIAPDLRGFGDSGPAPDGHYDMASCAIDLRALLSEVLGHDSCVACAGDYGMSVVYDLGLRYPGLVVRQLLFNGAPPALRDRYTEAGLEPDPPRRLRPAADYFVRQGTDAERLLAELGTPERRRHYVAGMYGHRLWAAPGAFAPADVDFHTEPFGPAAVFARSIRLYEYAMGREPPRPPRYAEPTPVPSAILYGARDQVVPASFPDRMRVACLECLEVLVVPEAGHFLQWEAPETLNRALIALCRDLIG